MPDKKISFHKACIDQKEIDAVTDTLKSGWITMGPKVKEFEKKFSDYIGAKFSISVNSATAALHLSLRAIDLKRGDEVIIPTNTFVATAEVVVYFGAKPVLCDVEYDTHNIDTSKIESLITSNTKAIIPVHFSGQPCDMREIHDIVKKHKENTGKKIYVIEDAAHALPSKYNNKLIGSLSDLTCFSFYATKTLAVGEGGMVTTNSKQYADSIKINRLHGISRDVWNRSDGGGWFYDVVSCGNKYNMTDISASIGLVQLNKLDDMNYKRGVIADKYDNAFKGLVKHLAIRGNNATSNHLYVLKVSDRDKLYDMLKENNIDASVHFIPIHFHAFYKSKFNYKRDDYPIANKVFNESLSIPIYPDMSEVEVNKVIQVVTDYAKNDKII